jgi:hypothetical protein
MAILWFSIRIGAKRGESRIGGQLFPKYRNYLEIRKGEKSFGDRRLIHGKPGVKATCTNGGIAIDLKAIVSGKYAASKFRVKGGSLIGDRFRAKGWPCSRKRAYCF